MIYLAIKIIKLLIIVGAALVLWGKQEKGLALAVLLTLLM